MRSLQRLVIALAASIPSFGLAAELPISQSPLEIPQGVAPNIMLLVDDSGSMAWEVITTGHDNNGLFAYDNPYSVTTTPVDTGFNITDRASCSWPTGAGAGAYDGYKVGVQFGTTPLCDVAADDAWRFRNSTYNHLYYDPTRIYLPWAGLHPSGKRYDEMAALVNSKALGVLVGVDMPTRATWTGSTNTLNLMADNSLRVPGTVLAKDIGLSYWTYTDDTAGVKNGLFENTDTHIQVFVKDLPWAIDAPGTINTKENFQNWFNFYRSRDLASKGALHYVLEDLITARVGYTTINATSSDTDLNFAVQPINVDSAKQTLLAKIDATVPNGGTPLRSALKGVGEYFTCTESSESNFGTDCPILPVADGGSCQQNYTVLFTDGNWNDANTRDLNSSILIGEWEASFGDNPAVTRLGVGNTDGGDPTRFDDGSVDSGSFGDKHLNTLADVAMYYYENDLSSYADEVPITETDRSRIRSARAFAASDKVMHQNMKTYTVAFGLTASSFASDIFSSDFNPDTLLNWPDPLGDSSAKTLDLMHAAYNGRGSFYAASDYSSLADSLQTSFSRVIADQSGAAGVSFNSQELKTGTYIFRAFYNPATFDGDLVAVVFDQNGVPDVDNPIWSASEQLSARLADPEAYDSRLIVTYDPGVPTGTDSNAAGRLFNFDALTAKQKTDLETDPPSASRVGDYLSWGDARVGYLRGDRQNEGANALRQRAGLLGDFANSTPRYVGTPQGVKRDLDPYPNDSNIGTLLDDRRLYSTFKTAYLDRDQVVYSGANDGMLHAFDALTGQERFAYVPNLVLDDLYQYTQPDYIHEMSVDGSPGINDVYILDNRTVTGKTEKVDVKWWRTILMGGLRAGGKGYYALDITDPDTFTNAATGGMSDNVLWEFTSADDSRLGYTFSTPNMVMSNAKYPDSPAASDNRGSTDPLVDPTDQRDNRWISLFGNGYNQCVPVTDPVTAVTSCDPEATSSLFALFVDHDGSKIWQENVDYVVMDTGTAGDGFPNGLGTPRGIDADGNGTVDYVYAGDLMGNLYRFDLRDEDPTNWSMTQVLFKAEYVAGTPQPITIQPIATRAEGGGYVVIASTGSWMTTDDITSTDIQSLYGVWDPDPTRTAAIISKAKLVEQVFTNASSPLYGYTYRTLTANTVNYGNKKGWFIDFDMPAARSTSGVEYPGEKAIRNLLVKEGVLFGVTILPSSNAACSTAPGGFLFSIDAKTGGLVVQQPAFDLNGDGSFDIYDVNPAPSDDEVIVDNEIPAAIRIEDGLPSDIAIIDGGKSEGSKVCYQTSTGELVCSNANVGSRFPEGRLSWKELSE
jgi:type IV pilus assembly protein PilY1